MYFLSGSLVESALSSGTKWRYEVGDNGNNIRLLTFNYYYIRHKKEESPHV